MAWFITPIWQAVYQASKPGHLSRWFANRLGEEVDVECEKSQSQFGSPNESSEYVKYPWKILEVPSSEQVEFIS